MSKAIEKQLNLVTREDKRSSSKRWPFNKRARPIETFKRRFFSRSLRNFDFFAHFDLISRQGARDTSKPVVQSGHSQPVLWRSVLNAPSF
jgi:hypothetical protein